MKKRPKKNKYYCVNDSLRIWQSNQFDGKNVLTLSVKLNKIFDDFFVKSDKNKIPSRHVRGNVV